MKKPPRHPAQTLGRMGYVYTIPEPEYVPPPGACPYCEYRPCRCDDDLETR